MAGHSKWSNMRYRKASQDIKKDKIFTKIARELNSASKLGGTINPQYNTKLRLAIEKGLSYNMNRSTIKKILFKKLNKKILSVNMTNISYEGYGPGNIALIINCVTNNKNRTVSEIRNSFSKIGHRLGNSGAVSYMFQKKIKISFYNKNNVDYVMDIAEKLQAEDIIINNKIIDLIFNKEKYKVILLEMKKILIKPVNFKLTMIPLIKQNIDILTKNKLLNFLNLLKLNNDIKKIYHNANI
ncbi:YebC/PmpR family DNA-binding transcriptional regulator [Enterobacteriaceae endosymbiont of Plateumaris pusilla]|uniref:YebC/PmpR family DNA-binding transcriptional regulator n=1 Tax=Enterobacteriaceae endosymbiont of Plateumaris pusilla TaxID=2675795 RepID=UPI001448D706|nr:YebC/PmpR family DNA-binding transcriptional regulator [Enterobacteriaceae endosymbiont of Plateumaris pusilla]QJC29710.1 YebC/PmpR family DNA-binding transcriptional regulator [Enterobacteriaceae endosymbiont of Plateumaris pusilla]